MVAQLTSLRTEIVDALNTAGIKAIHYVGEAITPPVAVVIPGDRYLTPGEVFGHTDVAISVLVISGKGTNKSTADSLDSMIEKVIAALDEWDIEEVAQPGQVTLNGNQFLGTVVSVTQTIKLS